MAEQPGAPQPARQTPEQVAKEQAALGPNASSTDVPDDHHFIVNGNKVNAWGEKIDSPEAKKRRGIV